MSMRKDGRKLMRRLALVAAILVLGLGAPQTASAQNPRDLAEDLADALEELFERMQPALDEALDLMQKFGIDDPGHYRAPEILPNGDVIIRRREDAPPFRREPIDPPAGAQQEDAIDL